MAFSGGPPLDELQTVNIKDARAMPEMDIVFYTGVISWPALNGAHVLWTVANMSQGQDSL